MNNGINSMMQAGPNTSVGMDGDLTISDVTLELSRAWDQQYLDRITWLGPPGLRDEVELNPGGLLRALRRSGIEFEDFRKSLTEPEQTL